MNPHISARIIHIYALFSPKKYTLTCSCNEQAGLAVRCRMRNTLLVLLLLSLFSSCRKDIDLAAGQRFVLPLVANEQECRQIQQNSIVFNCFQEIEFQDNNRVTVMVTDIINTGRYKHRGKHIIIEFDQAYDVENKMKLEIVDNNTIRYKGRDFKRWKGPGGWDLY